MLYGVIEWTSKTVSTSMARSPHLVASGGGVQASNEGDAVLLGSDGKIPSNVLPDVGGGEVWEAVDLNNWPTDWVDGDRIKICIKESRYPITAESWDTLPTLGNLTKYATLVYGEIRISSVGCKGLLYTFNSNNAITIISFDVDVPFYLNKGFRAGISQRTFNGAGVVTKTSYVDSSYVKYMWRLKK